MPRELPGPERLYPYLFQVLSGEEWKSLQEILDGMEELWKKEPVPNISVFMHRSFPGISQAYFALTKQEEKKLVEKRTLEESNDGHKIEWRLTQTGVVVQKVSALTHKNVLARFLIWFSRW